MCRAVRVLIVSASEDARARLRGAVGVEAEVAAALAAATEPFHGDVDVVIVDGGDARAAENLAAVRESQARAGIVWVGDEPPPGVHATISLDGARDALPGAIVRALIARRP